MENKDKFCPACYFQFFRVNTLRYSHDMALICTVRLWRDTIIFVLSCLLPVPPQNSSSCSLVTALPNTNLETVRHVGCALFLAPTNPFFLKCFFIFFGNKKIRKEDKIESDRTGWRSLREITVVVHHKHTAGSSCNTLRLLPHVHKLSAYGTKSSLPTTCCIFSWLESQYR